MNLADEAGLLAYVAVFLAAIVEGEIMFVVAATLASQGRLDPVGVIVSGAVGAATGDQLIFYLLHGRLRRLLDRWPRIARRGQALAARVRRADTLMVFSIRFSPGLRVALLAACAYAHVPPLKFSLVSLVSCVVWATVLMSFIAWIGPAWLPSLGISGWWSALIPAAIVIALVRIMTRTERAAGPVDGQ